MCEHESCGVDRRIWIPIDDDIKSEPLLHPWCIHCGLVKNISDDNPYKIGYWINLLSLISKIYPIKKVQKRLITKNLIDTEGFTDSYGTTGLAQEELFIKIIGKYTNINEERIKVLIH